jgi:hypothetical protein
MNDKPIKKKISIIEAQKEKRDLVNKLLKLGLAVDVDEMFLPASYFPKPNEQTPCYIAWVKADFSKLDGDTQRGYQLLTSFMRRRKGKYSFYIRGDF